MARILIGANWFDGISSRSWNETDFEALVVDRAAQLFPGWICVRFTEKVIDDSQVAKQPDLALIDPQYRTWWVIEVELAHHSLVSHVLPQVRVFRQGHYGQRHAAALASKTSRLDSERLSALMLGEPPGVAVVVDSITTNWREALRDAGVKLIVAEPFRDGHGTIVLRLNGDQPDAPTNVLTRCSRVPTLRRIWRVHSPAALPRGPLAIEWDGALTTWETVLIGGGVQLKAARGDILAEYASVDLVMRDDGSLIFIPVQRIRRTA